MTLWFVACGFWGQNAKIDQADPQIFEFKISKIEFKQRLVKEVCVGLNFIEMH